MSYIYMCVCVCVCVCVRVWKSARLDLEPFYLSYAFFYATTCLFCFFHIGEGGGEKRGEKEEIALSCDFFFFQLVSISIESWEALFS